MRNALTRLPSRQAGREVEPRDRRGQPPRRAVTGHAVLSSWHCRE